MKTYNNIHCNQICEILMQAAMGVSAVCGYRYTTSDMVYSLNELAHKARKEPYYIAIREQGTESGSKTECLDRCKSLGYPIIIAKIEKDEVCDYNMTIKFCWNVSNDKKNSDMEQEFNSL